ncbi:MAG: hypothetical protein R3F04_07330 [Lysobacteraceae bacterium]
MRCGRPTIFLLILLIGGASQAATLNWPDVGGGSTACQTTLQSCIDQAVAGDSIRIMGDASYWTDELTEIDEDLVIAKPLTLYADADVTALFTAGRDVSIFTAGLTSGQIQLNGLVFASGGVRIEHAGEGLQVALSRLNFRDAPADTCYIHFYPFGGAGGGVVDFSVSDSIFQARSAGPQRAAICAAAVDGASTLNVLRNRIETALPRFSAGVVVTGNGWQAVNVLGNVLRARDINTGILVQEIGARGSAAQISVRNNLVRGQRAPISSSGAAISIQGENLHANVIHNTVVDNTRGIEMFALNAGVVSGRVSNNLVAFSEFRGLELLSGGISNDYNLVYQAASPSTALGPNTVQADPLLRDLASARPIGAASPAVNAGLNADLPALSGFGADGEVRLAQSTTDIGAFEYTLDLAASVIADAGNTAFNTTDLDSLTGLTTLDTVMVSPVRNVFANEYAVPLGVYLANASPVVWSAFLQDFTRSITLGRQFNVLAPLYGANAFRHVADAASLSGSATLLDHAALNNLSSAIAVAVGRYESSSGSYYHNHPISLAYGGNRWRIRNEDGAAMEADHAFNVVVAPLFSPNAFTRLGNRLGLGADATELRLNHPLLDDNPCAAPQISRVDDPFDSVTTLNPIPFALQYREGSAQVPGHWYVMSTESGQPLPAAGAYNVIVNGAQALDCQAGQFAPLLFADGFE